MDEKPSNPLRWTRREAIVRASAVLGGTALIGQSRMLAALAGDQPVETDEADAGTIGAFDGAHIELLGEIAETILPETDTPGAKAAGVGPFIALMVTDVYSPSEQQIFMEGLAALELESQQAGGTGFTGLSAEQRLELAGRLDREQHESSKNSGDAPPHYFRMLKELTVLGFFTSEIAYREVLEYVETPGRYDGNRDLTPDVRVFAGHGARGYRP